MHRSFWRLNVFYKLSILQTQPHHFAQAHSTAARARILLVLILLVHTLHSGAPLILLGTIFIPPAALHSAGTRILRVSFCAKTNLIPPIFLFWQARRSITLKTQLHILIQHT